MKQLLTLILAASFSVAVAQLNPNLNLNNPNQNEFITFQQTEIFNAPVNPEMVKLAPIGMNETNLIPMQMVNTSNFNCPVTPPAMNQYFIGNIKSQSLQMNNIQMNTNYVFDIQGNLRSSSTEFTLIKN